MTSPKRPRDQAGDHLLTPQNAALLIIDFQPVQISSVASQPRPALVQNIVSVVRTALLFELPIILSTVNVDSGRNKPTIHHIKSLIPEIVAIDRTSINAWEDEDFVAAVKATGRRKLVVAALWTEACLAFAVLDALKAGYDVFPIIDAVGGTSAAAHQAGLARIEQAGAKPTSWVQLICELQRDWNRTTTAIEFAEILFTAVGV